MTVYAVAWLTASVSAVLVAALLFFAFRRWGSWRHLAAGLVLAWSLTPCRFDGEHWAPAFIVATFRLLFEDAADPTVPLALLGAATAAVFAVHLVAKGIRALAAARRTDDR